jgi:UrcA family protein
MLRKLSIISAVALISFSAQAASAGDRAQVDMISEKVQIGDLNLSNKADAKRAINRLSDAALRICGIYKDSSIKLAQANYARKCRTTTLTAAVERAGIPALTLALQEDLKTSRVMVARN